MHTTTKTAILLAAIIVASCATQPRPVTDSTTRLEYIGFSLLPPQGSNWYFQLENRYGANFGKLHHDKVTGAADAKNTFLISAFSDKVAVGIKIDTPERLLAFSEAYLRAKTAGRSGRYRTLSLELIPYHTQETDCVRFDQEVEERNNPKFPGILQITAIGLICRNSFSADWFIDAFYSQRYEQGAKPSTDGSFQRESEALLKSVVFTPPE